MALTESKMISIGTKAPNFTLYDTVSDKNLSLSDVKGTKGTVIVFSCNHCPFVIHINDELIAFAKAYVNKGINMVAISSNDVENYPMDGPKEMAALAKKLGYPFPYLFDESQEVAKSYDAACTPDIYLFDASLKLYYRGRLDGSRPGNGIALNGIDLRSAADDLIAGKEAPLKQYPSAGCNIKWK